MLILYPIKLKGKLINDPENTKIRCKNKIKFTIATERYFGEKNEPMIDYYNIITNGELAKTSLENLKAGMQVTIDGTIVIQSYGADKQTNWIIEVAAEKVNIVDEK